MKSLQSIMIVSALLLPVASIAASCDTKYPNMYVGIEIKNNNANPIECAPVMQHGAWQTAIPSSSIAQNDDITGQACYDDDGSDEVSGKINCYAIVNSGGIQTKGVLLGTMEFEHVCGGGLTHMFGGSCGGSLYTNNNIISYAKVPSSFQTEFSYLNLTNPSQVDYAMIYNANP